jgi:hypothetical protein
MATATIITPADALAAIIAAGVARYQESLPDFARDDQPVVTLPDFARPLSELPEPEPNVSAVDEEGQRELCLSCPLADCLGIESTLCPIRIEQLRARRKQRRQRQWPN